MSKIVSLTILVSFAFLVGCVDSSPRREVKPVSSSGVKKMTVKVETDTEGRTSEQRNIARKYAVDNEIGAIKHLYVISAYSGDVILYSTVSGKVTSSGKRLTPKTVVAHGNGRGANGFSHSPEFYGMSVTIDGRKYRTTEVLQDDGTYGSSIPYLIWVDAQDRFHQHYISGGQVVHISETPMNFPKVIMNVETQGVPKTPVSMKEQASK